MKWLYRFKKKKRHLAARLNPYDTLLIRKTPLKKRAEYNKEWFYQNNVYNTAKTIIMP